METKTKPPVKGVPDLSTDKTFPHLVVGLAQCSDVRTVEKWLLGKPVGRSDLERETLTERLLKATKWALEIRQETR